MFIKDKHVAMTFPDSFKLQSEINVISFKFLEKKIIFICNCCGGTGNIVTRSPYPCFWISISNLNRGKFNTGGLYSPWWHIMRRSWADKEVSHGRVQQQDQSLPSGFFNPTLLHPSSQQTVLEAISLNSCENYSVSPNVQCWEMNILIKWSFTAFSVSLLRAQTLMPAVNVAHLVCLFGSV